jgi:hypothetical protein
MTRDTLALVVASVITVAWVGSLITDAALPSYDPPASIHPLMLLVAGYLFGSGIFKNGRD